VKTIMTAVNADIKIGRTLSNSTPFALEIGGLILSYYGSIDKALEEVHRLHGNQQWVMA